MKYKHNYKLYLNGLFLIVFLIASIKLIKKTAIYPYGDGLEYVLMTESFNNHFTPELKYSDIDNYIQYLEKNQIEIHKKDILTSIKDLYTKDVKLLDDRHGFFVDKNQQVYSYHFWVYSLLNTPVRKILGWFNLNISYTFVITNYLFLFLTLLLIFTRDSFNYRDRIVLSLFIIFSPIFWYLGWTHPEAFAGLMVFSSLVLFYDQKHYWAIFLMAITSTHFPPLFIPVLIMLIYKLRKDGVTFKNLFYGGITSFWVILPSLFYLYHYSIPNLIIAKNFISTDYVSLNRLHSFLFDWNQGMILGLPLVLFMSIFLFVYRIIKRKFKVIDMVFASVFLMAYFYLQMGNWSHGMSVVNRYVVWNAAIIIFYSIYLLSKIENIKVKYVLFTILFIPQVLSVYYFSDIKHIHWKSSEHNKIALWFFDNYPHWYNPDPHIFQVRTSKANLSYTDSVIVYNKPDSTINKMMVYKGQSIYQLEYRGVNKQKIDSFLMNKKYYNDWIYINKKELDELGYIQENDTLINYIENKNNLILREKIKNHILSSPSYIELIEQKAKDWDLPFEEVLEMDIEYLIKVEKEKIFLNKKDDVN